MKNKMNEEESLEVLIPELYEKEQTAARCGECGETKKLYKRGMGRESLCLRCLVIVMKKELDFIRFQKYLNEIKEGKREADGIDEFGEVPYICERCKRNEAQIYSQKGNFCAKCDKEIKNE